MIPLAWCPPTTLPPDPLTLMRCGRLAVLCAPMVAGARDRLALLQQAFDAGLDLVPLAAGHVWPLAEACDSALCAEDDLCTRLDRVAGQGQATLSLQWAEPRAVLPSGGSGRDWLHRLRQQHNAARARADRAAEVLAALTEAHPGPKGAVTAATTGLRQSLLLPRGGLGDLHGKLRARALADHGFSLCVTGLWPAFDFVCAPLHRAGASA